MSKEGFTEEPSPEKILYGQVKLLDQLQKEIIKAVEEYAPQPSLESPDFDKDIERGGGGVYTCVQRWSFLDRVLSFTVIDKFLNDYLGSGYIKVCRFDDERLYALREKDGLPVPKAKSRKGQTYDVELGVYMDKPSEDHVRCLLENNRITSMQLRTFYYFSPDGTYRKYVNFPRIPPETKRLSWKLRPSEMDTSEAEMLERMLTLLLLKVQKGSKKLNLRTDLLGYRSGP